MAKRPEVFIVSGTYAGRSFQIHERGVRLGRSSSNDVQIPDEELSRSHCLFEPSGDTDIRLTDLASANGTILNGALIGNAPVVLKVGDSIKVGQTTLRVGISFESEPTVSVGRVDLGLGGNQDGDVQLMSPVPRKSLTFRILAAAAALCVAGAVAVFVTKPEPETKPPVKPLVDNIPLLREFAYEYVKADLNGIFRYELALSADYVLSVRVDDVPAENRHMTKSAKLSADSFKELSEVLDFKLVKDLDREYVGPEPEPTALESRSLRIVYSTRARTVKVINASEPLAFRSVREKLETFAKSALGIWAIQYPREKLIELAEQSLDLAETKWSDRDTQYGNIAAAVAAYRETLFYLETVNPKPACDEKAHQGLARAISELDKRSADQRFVADRALNLGNWAEARRELQVLLEMVPDRNDDRNRDAHEKLLEAEKHLKKGAGVR